MVMATPTAPHEGLISVIMTVRDGAEYLQPALDSLYAQSDGNFEIVVVDDGSTDETAGILSRQTDLRLTIRSHPPKGRAEALAEAVSIARGELVAVLDSDDVSLPHRLETQRRFLSAHPNIALVGSAAIEFDGAKEWRRGEVSGPRQVRRALGMHNPFYHSSIMFRRAAYDAVGGYRPDGGWGHDKDLLIRIAARFPVDIIPEPLIRYRRHAAQISGTAEGESFRRKKSASLQLRAARDLGLPFLLWIVPVCGWIYAHVPAAIRPHALKDPVKSLLLRLFRSGGTPAKRTR